MLTITKPDDFHVHLRNDAICRAVTPYTTNQFARAVIMPNLVPAVKTTADVIKYRDFILSITGNGFTPLMTLYLTEETDPEDLIDGHKQGLIFGVKYYPAGATTNAHGGVRDYRAVRHVFDAMQAHNIPLLLHGESIDPQVDIFDRERVYLSQTLAPIMNEFPNLRISLEHITTKDSVDFVLSGGDNIAATITPHHLIINRNDIFKGGVRPHFYCLPIAKRETHRLALCDVVAGGSKKFFAGTDSAPHLSKNKENACGCAGIFNAPNAVEAYCQIFDQWGCMDKLEAFLSHNGADFHRIPRNKGVITIIKEEWRVPNFIGTEQGDIVPFFAGEILKFKVK